MGREKEGEKTPASLVLVSSFPTIVNLALVLMRAICSGITHIHNCANQIYILSLIFHLFFLSSLLCSFLPSLPLVATFPDVYTVYIPHPILIRLPSSPSQKNQVY